MIVKVFSIIFYVIAGFFIYMECVIAFIDEVRSKFVIMAGFMVPCLIAHGLGLALNRFRNWKKHTAIVLLSGAGFTVLLMLILVFIYMSEELRKVMEPDTLQHLSDYVTGGGFTLLLILIGVVLLRAQRLAQPPVINRGNSG